MENIFKNKRVLITGGTGSLGKTLVKTLLSGQYGLPASIVVFSRDEAKQHDLRVAYAQVKKPTDEIIFNNFNRLLSFRIGDVRNYASIGKSLRNIDIVINAAALKQVPSCEYFIQEACLTNITGASNIVRAIEEHALPIETVVGVSTDKACLPINAMGMTKALQERLFIAANITCPQTRFIVVRYGNVLASRGSVIPLFQEQILSGATLTITHKDMTRFLLPLSEAVRTIATALKYAKAGEVFVPKIPSALIVDVAKALIADRNVKIEYTGIRPGEKIHELIISPEEGYRTYPQKDFYAISPMLPELQQKHETKPLNQAYGSNDFIMSFAETVTLLQKHNLLLNARSTINLNQEELLA